MLQNCSFLKINWKKASISPKYWFTLHPFLIGYLIKIGRNEISSYHSGASR